MNRRDLIMSGWRSLLGLGAVAIGIRAAESTAPQNAIMRFNGTSGRVAEASRIVRESGEMWLACRNRLNGRNPVVIAFDDDKCVEARYSLNHWKLSERYLNAEEAEQREACRKHVRFMFNRAPDSAVLPRIGARCPFDYRLRAWIKNGRSREWLPSIDGYKTKISA